MGANPVLDRRGIVLGSEEELHGRRSAILWLIRDILNLSHTPGWEDGPADYAEAIMAMFYPGESHRYGWVMIETCRDQMRNRHQGLQERPYRNEKPRFLQPALSLEAEGSWIGLKAGIHLPSRHLRFALPDDRKQADATLVRASINRTLHLPTQVHSAVISTWCVATDGLDNSDLAKGFVPSGPQCRRPDGLNGACLITWFRLNCQSTQGYLESQAIDFERITGQTLSFREQTTVLRTAIELDPWLNDWLTFGLRHFRSEKRPHDGTVVIRNLLP
jgi:hypothetical protein